MENSVTLQAEIKSILAVKAKEGATYQEIKDEYFYLMGEEICLTSFKQFNEFMRSITGVHRGRNSAGVLVWFSNSEKSKHIAKLVINQKSPREKEQCAPLTTRSFHKSTSVCFYNDNYIYKKQRQHKSYTNLIEKKVSGGNAAFFYDYELIGDEFFLEMAHIDLKYPHSYTRAGHKGRSVRKCGHCVSGQTIEDVTKMLKSNVKIDNRVIINIGSVDLLHGRDLVDLKQDFIAMYKEFERRNIEPMITTLAPLANICFSDDVIKTWKTFNAFLLNNFPNVLDLSACFLTNGGRVLFDCYQPSAKYVTGSSRAHCLWNYVGRQRVVKYLKQGVTELAYRNSIFRKCSSF